MTQVPSISPFLYSDAAVQLPKIDVNFDMVLQDTAKQVDSLDSGAGISQRMPKAGESPASGAMTGEQSDSLENVVYQMQAATYSQAIVGLVGSVGSTIKALVKGG